MSKIISMIFLALLVLSNSACTAKPTKSGNTPDQQRKNAHETQDELSSEIKR